jgi:hypothetical protein
MAEANWSAPASQVARTGEGGLAVRLQLRGAQPYPVTETDSSIACKAQGAVCLNNGCKPRG